MSAFSTITLLFPGIGLVALAIGLLARRYSHSVLVVGLTGLLALTTAATWITVAGLTPNAAQHDKLMTDNEELKGALATKQAELEDARKQAREPAERALPTEQSNRAEAQRYAADADQRAAAATASVAELEEKVREAQNGKAEAEHRSALLDEKLRAVPLAPPAPRPPDLPSVRRKLTDGDRQYYASQEERELIRETKGTWYAVRLLQGGRDWNFADRQFVLADATGIKASAIRLRDDVLLPLSQAGQNWRLFVRGAADARRVAGPVGRELSYLPRLSDGTYSPELRGKRVTVPVQNEVLPTLRADWLREIVQQVFGAVGTNNIDILENRPLPEHGRTAELVLYVEW